MVNKVNVPKFSLVSFFIMGLVAGIADYQKQS